MSTGIIKVRVRGARRVGFPLSQAGRRLQKGLLDEFNFDIGPILLRSGRAYAPHRSGNLERHLNLGVRSYGGGITATLYSDAVSDEGFAYTNVTRFGHRKAFIVPIHAKALRLPMVGGGAIFRRRVRGYRPAGDWVDRAFEAADVQVERAEDRIGRELVSRVMA